MAEMELNGEQWTAEGARLLLEVDEGWAGYRNDSAWRWCDDAYVAYHAVCLERKWLSHSLASCAAMLHALRTGAISMTLSSSTRCSDLSAQWSLSEMRELGAQMRRVVDGQSPKVRWAAQFAAFVEAMATKDPDYDIKDRTVEDFAARAAKYVPKTVLRLIDPDGRNGKATPRTRKTPKPKAERRATKGRAAASKGLKSGTGQKPLVTRTTRSGRVLKRGRRRSIESDGDSSYHDPSSENEDILWGFQEPLSLEDASLPPTQELTSQGELLPARAAVNELPAFTIRDSARPSLPLEAAGQAQPSSPTSEMQAAPRQQPRSRQEPASRQAPPHQEEPVQHRAALQDVSVSVQRRAPSRQSTATEAPVATARQNSESPTQQLSRKYLRVQQASGSNRGDSGERASNKKTAAPTMFPSLNPYGRPGKPWGEFVVEVLLAERTACNEDELDYVQFVRSLYDI
jgi:hypothetical protein